MKLKKFRPRKITLIKSFCVKGLFLLISFIFLLLLFYFLRVNFFIFISILFFLILTFVYVGFIEPYRLELNCFKVRLKKAGFNAKVIHLSDIHFGNLFDSFWLKKIVKIVNGIGADFIFITGDFLLGENEAAISKLANILKDFKAKFGVWAVLGNHDLYCDSGILIEELKKSNVEFLINQAVEFNIGNKPLWALGVNDPYHEEDDLISALREVADGHSKILLAHSPDIIDKAVECGIDLVIAGHTHGGQMRLPGFKKLISVDYGHKKYVSGLYNVNGTLMYVNRGLGRVMLPFRLFCRPEIAVIEIE